MNRYPLWKTSPSPLRWCWASSTLPNFFGESPAVQVSSAKATIKVDKTLTRVETALKAAGIAHDGIQLDFNGVKSRASRHRHPAQGQGPWKRPSTRTRRPQYVVALNLLTASPDGLTGLHALPMYLGLDLRGGVHFLLQVDMKGALTKRLDSTGADLRTLCATRTSATPASPRAATPGDPFRDAEVRDKARNAIADSQPDLLVAGRRQRPQAGRHPQAGGPETHRRIRPQAEHHDLHNRINELGVAEPVIQQQGADRIVVQLPGVQDTAKAKDILGRTATLEIRMVDEDPPLEAALAGNPPFGTEAIPSAAASRCWSKAGGADRRPPDRRPARLRQPDQEPAVHLTLDSAGARIFRDITRENVGKRMAILLIEKGKGEVVTAR